MNPPEPSGDVPPPLRMLLLISMSLVALPGVPQSAVGPVALEVPHWTAIRTPPGKLVIVLLVSSDRVRINDVAATPPANSWIPEPSEFPPAPVVVPLVIVLFEMLT